MHKKTILLCLLSCFVSSVLAGEPSHLWRTLYGRADELYHAGEFDRGLSVSQEALEEAVDSAGHVCVAVAVTLNLRGRLFSQTKDYEKAEESFKKSIQILAELEGPSSPLLMTVMSNMAITYRERGNYEKAIQVLSALLKQVDPDTFDYSWAMHVLALAYRDSREYDKAEALLKQSIAYAEEKYGAMHREHARRLNSLGVLYSNQGRYDAALPLQQSALKISLEAYGGNHYQTGIKYLNVASVLVELRQYDDAIIMANKCLAILEERSRMNHIVLGAYGLLWRCYSALDDGEKAAEYHAKLVRYTEEQSNGASAHILHVYGETLIRSGYAHYRDGDYEKALRDNLMAVNFYAQQGLTNSCAYGVASVNLADAYEAVTNYIAASKSFDKVIQFIEKNNLCKNLDYTHILSRAYEASWKAGLNDRAEQHLAKLVKLWEEDEEWMSNVRVGVLFGGQSDGARIAHVFSGSPGEKAGLIKGDVLVAVNNQESMSGSHAHELIVSAERDEPLHLRVFRNDDPLELIIP